MRNWLLTWGALFILSAVASHLAIILAIPRFVMDRAMDRIAAAPMRDGWMHAPRVTEASRAVVRPSPDLAYSACLYDLGKGPVRIRVAPWAGYFSVSLYDANSDNYRVFNDRTAPEGVDVLLVRSGETPPAFAGTVVEAPSAKGLVLQRRLAPDAARFAAADAARRGDRCLPSGADTSE